jgi:hypothetical protein
MKTMFGKRYPNCVKKTKSEEVEVDTSSNITELNKLEKVQLQKGLQRYKGKKTSKKNVEGLKKTITDVRDDPRSTVISPRRKIENMMQNTKKSANKGTIFDTAKRQKDFRGKGKKQSSFMDKMGMQVPPFKGKRVKGSGDSNRQLDLPGNQNVSKTKNIQVRNRLNQFVPRDQRKPATPVYNKNKIGQLTSKSVNYDKVPDTMKNKMKNFEKGNFTKGVKKEEVEVDTSSNVSEEFYRKKYDVKKGGYVKTDKMTKSNKRSGDSKAEYRDLHKDLAKYKIKKLKTEEMGNIAHTKTKKDGKTIIKVNKNDELDAQAAMKNDPKYILGKTRVQPYKEGYSANPAQQAAIAIAKREKKERDMVAKKTKKEDWRSELGYVEEAKKKMVKVKLGDPSKIKVKVTDIGAGGKEYVRKDEMNEAKSPAWQRKAGKSESGGLNAKGVASYRAANPGSKLKTAVTTKPSKLKKGSKAANRRKSFCARMKGMKKRLTSAKTARDPDSRINKSLRKWNC